MLLSIFHITIGNFFRRNKKVKQTNCRNDKSLLGTQKSQPSKNKKIMVRVKHLPEKWLVIWHEKKEGRTKIRDIERREFFNSEKEALDYAKELEKQEAKEGGTIITTKRKDLTE